MPESRKGPEGPLAARALVGAALASLEAGRERIDNLNVYPVPDGDTGTNMALTVRAARDVLAASQAPTRADVAREITRACLMGARGNSGVILSQLVRGAAEALAEAGRIDAARLAEALRAGSDAGYAAVREPQEGTILTVARELAERAEALAPGDPSLGDALGELVRHGEEALARTPEQLPLLREAGVVDAGGAGLLELLRGIAAHVRGEALAESASPAEPLPLDAIHQELSRFRYCTSFFVEGPDADPDLLERELGEFGDSVLVVGASGAVKAHFHTDEPGRALSLATALGVVEEVDIRNMHAQAAERTERLLSHVSTGAAAVIAVVAGEGNARLFRSLGASRIVTGGQSMNPPTSEIVAAIEAVPEPEAIVLPNNKNVVLAAEQAAAAASKPTLVVSTRSIQAGLAAMVSFEASRPAAVNATAMEAAAMLVRSGAVTRASRTTALGGLEVEQGQFLGLVDGEAVAAASTCSEVARAVVERLLDGRADVLTILLGEGAEVIDMLVAEIEEAHPQLEVEVHQGGQPHYPLLLSAE
ncbi:MAG: DAK2 domain-containing protein [Actinobacteria bacterium]|nr:DAK2 domain-containing protein [Actinomycetota bacterium]